MDSVAATLALTPPRYGWMSALGALLAGSIVGSFALLVLGVGIELSGLHILPNGYPAEPGAGWPFRIDSAWAALADLGPLLLVATVVACGIGMYVRLRTDRRTARWPIALCAMLVGWIPVAHSGRAGLLGLGGGFAFFAMWWTTHKTAEMPRPRPPGTRRLRVALAGVVALALAGISLSYGVLHPVRAAITDSGPATLRRGISDRSPLHLTNAGPLSVRVLGLSLPDAPGLRVARLEREGPRTIGPSIDSLYSPLGRPRIAAGSQRTVWLTLAGPVDCAEFQGAVTAVDVRLGVAGSTRTQRVRLAKPLGVGCRATRRH